MSLRSQQRGITLLLSLSVLAVLAILSTTFVRFMMTEREGSSNYALQVRAQHLAHGGMMRAVAELEESVYAKPYTDFSKEKWIYRGADGTGLGLSLGASLEDTKYPSFPLDYDESGTFDNGVAPASAADLVGGRAVSGMIDEVSLGVMATAGAAGENYGATQEQQGNVYILKVRDSASNLSINAVQSNLATLLDELGKAIAADVDGFDPVAGKGAAIVAYRDSLPGKTITDLDQLSSVLSSKSITYLREFVTCHGWTDPTTVKPDPHEDPATLPVLTIEPRNPVNINTAHKAVLRALLVGLAGWEFQFVETGDVYLGKATVVDEKKATKAITFAQAGLIADEIITARKTTPFKTWSQFDAFVDGLPTKSGLSGLTSAEADVIKANFNPNTMVSRFNPQRLRARAAEKIDLTRYSTEFCFHSMGQFEIRSVGLVTWQNGNVITRAEMYAVVEVGAIVRHSTQMDFEANKVSNGQTVSYPESIADIAGSGSPFDGQVEGFIPPPTMLTLTLDKICFKITATSAQSLPANHILAGLPDKASQGKAASSASNTKGWNMVSMSNEPKSGLSGFRMAPMTLGGGGKSKPGDSVIICFSVPKSSKVKTVSLGTKVGNKTVVTTTTIDPPDFSKKTDSNGLTIELLSVEETDDSGTASPIAARFYSPFYTKYDAVKGPAPVWSGDKTKPWKEEGKSLFAGSSLLPDGMQSKRALHQELGYSSDGNLYYQQGTIEFWIKLRGDGDTGSNEGLFYLVDVISGTTQKKLIGNKMIRWGDKLINTRFYAGHPSGETSPYTYSMTETEVDIGDWKAHEWHHIAMKWKDGTDQEMYVDGKKVAATLKLGTSYRFRLGSNEPGNEFTVGGYEFYSPSAVLIYKRGTVILKGQNYRFSNSTISGFKGHSHDKIYTGTSFALDDKFSDNPIKPAVWHGKFTFSLPYPVTIGSVAWTERQPKGWKASTYNSSTTSPDTDIKVEIKVDGGAWTTVPKAPASGGDGSGYLINKSLGVTSGTSSKLVEYRFTFENPGGITPLLVTPSIDDITLHLRRPTRFTVMRRVQ